MMGAGSIGGLPYASIGAFLRPFRLQMVWRKSGGKFSRPSAAILWKGVWRTEKIKAGKPVGLPRPFTVRGAFYPRRLRASTGGGCCGTTVRGKDTRHRWHFFSTVVGPIVIDWAALR